MMVENGMGFSMEGILRCSAVLETFTEEDFRACSNVEFDYFRANVAYVFLAVWRRFF